MKDRFCFYQNKDIKSKYRPVSLDYSNKVIVILNKVNVKEVKILVDSVRLPYCYSQTRTIPWYLKEVKIIIIFFMYHAIDYIFCAFTTTLITLLSFTILRISLIRN